MSYYPNDPRKELLIMLLIILSTLTVLTYYMFH